MIDKIPDEDFRALTDYLKSMVLRALEDTEDKPVAIGVRLLVRDGHCHVLPPTWAPAHPIDGEESGEISEPAVEVMEVGDRIVVTAELPGMSEEHVRTWQEGSTLIINALDGLRRYRRAVALPEVPLEVEATSFRNGVLDISFGLKSDMEAGDLYG
ncbi:MAG TPA: hypothetical protein ENN52_00205 [Methanofollis liminatans]|uniref:ArsA HSP20-like domain-containing protein n=1 Tax=Methanofollis liminatans TaxID=2201 RepID=A0A831LZ58_9EURY|nr:hypothetical protein [Methanofollis liminatans]